MKSRSSGRQCGCLPFATVRNEKPGPSTSNRGKPGDGETTVVGLYGLLAYTVTQRTREIGIRMALGGVGRGQVIDGVLWQALVLMVAGVAIGLTLTLWTSRLLQSFLYGVSKQDPWILALGPAVLLLCARWPRSYRRGELPL